MIHGLASAAVATTDTTEKSLGALEVPAKSKRIVGVWCYAIAGPGLTTLENVSGIFRLDSSDISLAPAQYPLDIFAVLTSGVGTMSPRIFPLNIPVNGKESITGYVTMDMALTVANTARWGMLIED